jgi:hypothetical protein
MTRPRYRPDVASPSAEIAMEDVEVQEAKSPPPGPTERAPGGEAVVMAVVASPRVSGQWRGRVRIADDFDAMPDDLAVAFGIARPRRGTSA